MKKLKENTILIAILIIAICTRNLDAQSLVEEHNQWNIQVYVPFSNNTYTYSIRIGGDSLVNNNIYNKVYKSVDSSDWILQSLFLRQDADKKVYLHESNSPIDSNETLLYDFGLEVNDTFPTYDFCTLIVTDIDSVQMNSGEYRRRLKLTKKDDLWYDNYWIDGIGSQFGMLSHFDYCLYDYGHSLLCFYSNEELLFPEDPFTCFIRTDVTELDDNELIKIYPNPTVDKIFIDDKNKVLTDYTILDASGQRIAIGKLDHSDLHEIDFQNISKGFYLIRFNINESNGYSYRLIKM